MLTERTRHRLLSKISPEPNTGCWLWLGALTRSGYGALGVGMPPNFTSLVAHRAIFEMFVGPIPDGKEIDHLCRVRECVNPEHLRAATHKENQRTRSLGQTHCARGHKFTPETTYIDPRGWRQCKTCRMENSTRYMKKPRGRSNASKTHCKRGHLYDAANTKTDSLGRRSCRTCWREKYSHWRKVQ